VRSTAPQHGGGRNDVEDDAAQLQACEEHEPFVRPADLCEQLEIAGVAGQLPVKRATTKRPSQPTAANGSLAVQSVHSMKHPWRSSGSLLGRAAGGPARAVRSFRIADLTRRPDNSTRAYSTGRGQACQQEILKSAGKVWRQAGRPAQQFARRHAAAAAIAHDARSCEDIRTWGFLGRDS
jgi:hypothetical protein